MSTEAVAPENFQAEEAVKNYYGKKLQTSGDLKTNACTSQPGKYPKVVRDAMGMVHEEVALKYYGCGPVFPPAVAGTRVLDLGSGSGKDCYTLSKLVGPGGSVVGLDMTDEQLAVANKYVDYHTKLFDYSEPNVQFVKGNMERMQEAGIDSDQFDIIVSNCVINLAKDKRAVLKEAYRVLKEGGELHFSDVYADRDLPPSVRDHEELWCECVVGALWWKDLHQLAKEIGFSTPRLVTAGLFSIDNKSYKEFLGDAKFVSATYSLFKLPSQRCATQTVKYNGNIEGYEEGFNFDYNIKFEKDVECHVKSELATILRTSRYKNFFTFDDEERGSCKCSQLEKDPFKYCEEKGNPKTCC